MSKEMIASIMNILTHLPKKITNNRNHNALADCVLYEISQEICLHFKEAAYFVYNPDFHLCKGISGLKRSEIHDWCNDPWNNISEFETIIKNTNYNKSIKKMQFCTLFSNKEVMNIVQEIQQAIDINSKEFFHWQLPNNNIGILLYESVKKENIENEKEYIESAVNLFGFCPLY